MRETFQIVGIVTTHFEDADNRTFPFNRSGQMIASGWRRSAARSLAQGQIFAGPEMKYLISLRDPGIADSGTTDHDPSRLHNGHFRYWRAFSGDSIACRCQVRWGYGCAGFPLSRAIRVQSASTFVKLGPGSAVDGPAPRYRRPEAVLQPLRYSWSDHPSQAWSSL